jgi:hypothetical protein
MVPRPPRPARAAAHTQRQVAAGLARLVGASDHQERSWNITHFQRVDSERPRLRVRGFLRVASETVPSGGRFVVRYPKGDRRVIEYLDLRNVSG